MQFSLPQILIFSQTGLHSQRQPGTSLLHQLVIDKVEPVKKINKKIGSFRIKNNVTEYLPGHYINIFSGKSDSLLHTTFIKKICQKTYLINYINLSHIHAHFLIPEKSYLLKSCGRLEIIGPYPGALSYSSNKGAATNL